MVLIVDIIMKEKKVEIRTNFKKTFILLLYRKFGMDEDHQIRIRTCKAMDQIDEGCQPSQEFLSEPQPAGNIAGLLESFEKSKQRLLKFIEKLGGSRQIPVSMEKYRSELPASKFQMFYSYQDIVAIVDNMIKKARSTRTNKKNWSKYDLIVMFWLIEKFNALNLKKQHQYIEEDWCYISSMIPGKTKLACLFKWLSLKMNNKTHRLPWTEPESEILMKMVMDRKSKGLDQSKSHWSTVSQQLYIESPAPKIYRTAKQCRERWSCTNPQIKKDLWSKKEDILLLKGFLMVGKKWAMISRQLGARTENAVKNRFELLEKRITNKAKKEAYQLPVKNYIVRYIQEMEADQMMLNNQEIKTVDITCHQPKQNNTKLIIPHQEKVSQQTQYQVEKQEIRPLRVPTIIIPEPQHATQETRKVTFCKISELMLNERSKNLVPAIFENEQLTLHKQSAPIRVEGWIKFDPMHNSAFKSHLI